MLLRQLLGAPVHFLKVTCQPRTLTLRGCAISNEVITSTPRDDEDDFFGITNKDFCNESKPIPFESPSNKNDLSKETILTKHLSKDVGSGNDLEKYVSTKFGKIRFDWQNTVPSKVEEISSVKIKESPQSNNDMDYFSEMYFGDSLNETQENSATVSNNDPNTVENENTNQKLNPKNDMDFIDSQYFGDYGENVNSNYHTKNPNSVVLEETFPPDHPQHFDIKKMSSNSMNFTNDDDFIESQYFSNTTNNTPQTEETFPPDHLQLFDFKKMSSDSVNVTNDDFIESQYFSNTANNTLQAESDSNASINNFKANFSDAAKNDLKESFPTKSFDNDNIHSPNFESSQNTKQKDNISKQNLEPQNAFEAVQKIRSEFKKKNEGQLVDSKGFRILKDQVNDLSDLTTYEIANHLKSRILYNKNDLIVINKPYGLPSHGGPGINVSIAKALGDLAKKIHHSGDLHLIHRLDKETTGVMLLAKTDKMAHTLKDMFREREVIKTYWALTKGIPKPFKGIIDIPIGEESVNGKHRMVLKPEYNKEIHGIKKSNIKSHQAITHYQVLSSSLNCALVECKTETGIKHQVRVHLAFGLNTPILGDHKYSHLTKLAPQRLFPEILEHLHIRQSKARHVPMHLHASSLILPEIINGKNFIFKAPLPYHFRKNMKSLKFSKSDKTRN